MTKNKIWKPFCFESYFVFKVISIKAKVTEAIYEKIKPKLKHLQSSIS